MQYVKWVCGKMCLRTRAFLVYRGEIKDSETFRLIHQLSISEVKMLLLITEAYNSRMPSTFIRSERAK